MFIAEEELKRLKVTILMGCFFYLTLTIEAAKGNDIIKYSFYVNIE